MTLGSSSEPPVEIPPSFLAYAARGPEFAAWLARLPRLLGDLRDEWSLRPDGPVMHGRCAVVAPVLDPAGVPAALKVGWPHPEAAQEHLVLRDWNGDGAVRLLRADPRRWALLLERADASTDLNALPAVEACEVVVDLHRRLRRPGGQYTTLSSWVQKWAGDLAVFRGEHVPRRYVEQAAGLARELAEDPGTDGVLIDEDLHYDNVLRSLRPDDPGWLVIDPKPLSGDPAYVVAPLLANRAAGRDETQRRFFTLVDGLGLDEDRARAWAVLRLVNYLVFNSPDDPHNTALVRLLKALEP